jgi:putative nucleotidyltransferase with HDIG domain
MYFSVSQELLQSEEILNFDVYLFLGNQYVLYAKQNQRYTSKLKEKLRYKDIETIYILSSQRPDFEDYVERNFARILDDPDTSMETKSEIFHETMLKNVKGFFQQADPQLNEEIVEQFQGLVRSSVEFLSQDEAIRNIGRLLSHDYRTYSHCMQVYTLSLALMNKYDYSEEDKVCTGIGALLHDMGKLKVPSSILNKPGRLNKEEWDYIKHHPVLGVGCCTRVRLSQGIINCILFHHEKCDGTGYPVGLKLRDIPGPVRILTICDIFDAITSNRAYAGREDPRRALRIMEDEMGRALDQAIFGEFIRLLENTSLV